MLIALAVLIPATVMVFDVITALRATEVDPETWTAALSEIPIVFQAAVPKLVASKCTTSGVRRPSEL